MKKLIRFIRKFFHQSEWYAAEHFYCLSGPGSLVHRQGSISNLSQSKDSVILGDNTSIAGILQVCNNAGKIIIGNSTFIGSGTRIYSAILIQIGNRVQVAHNCNIFDNNIHSIDAEKRFIEYSQNMKYGWTKKFDLREAQVIIEDDVWIGAGVTVLKGVKIGRGAIIGAASVVTDDVLPFSVVVGNPARIVKRIDAMGS